MFGLFIPSFLNEPPGRKWKPRRAHQEKDGWDDLEADGETPWEAGVGTVGSDEVDAKSDPRAEEIANGNHDSVHRDHETAGGRGAHLTLINGDGLVVKTLSASSSTWKAACNI